MELKNYITQNYNKEWILDTDIGYRYVSKTYDGLANIMKDIYDKKLVILKINKITDKNIRLYISEKDINDKKIKVCIKVNDIESLFEYSKNSLFYEVKIDDIIRSISVQASEYLLNEYVIVIEKRED